MNAKFKSILSVICAGVCALSVAACGSGAGGGTTTSSGGTTGGIPIGGDTDGISALLGAPKAVESVEYSALTTDGYKAFKQSVEAFAADFAAYTYEAYKGQDNFAVSPISVYMALALASECAAGDTRNEILSALGVTHGQLTTHFSTLYRSLEVEHKAEDKVTGLLDLSNSIWVNQGTDVKQPCIKALSNDYYAYSYSADFEHNNAEANKAIRDFVSKQTRGLIDKDFQLSEATLFALINTVYLKTIWNTDGNDLSLTNDSYFFAAKNGSIKNTKLLQGEYIGGRAVEFDTFNTFYTRTHDGYKIKFIVPKDGCTVDQVFTADNITAVNSITDYGDYDASEDVRYKTRVLFPEYKCRYDEDIKGILHDKFDIDLLFKNHVNYSPACDFSTLSDRSCYCAKVQHVTDLTVDKTGIEGAAVTVIGMEADAAPIVTVQKDFIVDKAFGFIITDWQNITLFSGVVNDI
ncbi:MAG: hypothetical protein K2K13_05025 [Clostridiales bacterium]|nr:hypothetical protein [Clostridiales bacterium]